MSNIQYNSDSIESLGILGGVRAKPSSIGLENHEHTFIEILANAIDEYREGFGKKIIVTKHADKSITIQDFGRSVPMAKNSKGEYAYKKVFDELWSGGKYQNNTNTGNYLFSLGTNGCGATGTNYVSDFFEVIAITPNKKRYYIRYEKGKQICDLHQEAHNLDYTSTIIHWLPSKEVFRGEFEISSEFIIKTIKQQSVINKGLKFIFTDEINNKSYEYYYENGIIDYIKELNNDKNFTDIVQWNTESQGKDNEEDDEYKIKCEITFCFNNEVNLIEYYHNSSFLENGGTPEVFIKNAFVYAIDKYLKDNNIYTKSDKKISFDDIKDSLIIISNTYSTISLYTDQVKKKISSKFMQEYMTEYLKHQLEIYFTENKLEADKIANQTLINKRANDKASQAKLDLKKKLQVKPNGLSPKIEGLKDCDMRNSELEEREFYITEGVSPSSTVIDARDPRIMGVYGLRGKFISSLKNSIKDVLNNEPALGVINGLGCGIELSKEDRKLFKNINTFNIENLRYGKIFISTDMDEWGYGIALSLITFFYKFMPKLLEQGRIYLSVSPRYEIETNKKDKKGEFITYFAYSEQDKEKIINKLENENVKYIINIVKGLGQLDKDVFWHYVLKKENRISKQIICKNINDENLEILFNTLMGDDIIGRKKYVKENITDLNIQELD